MRAPPLVQKARHFGHQMYEHARHGLAGINRAVETSARMYGGIIQPLLRHHGVDTLHADTMLMSAYDSYDTARAAAQKFDRLLQS